MSPRVSIVMPAYNDLRFLDAAVGSVLRQTFTDFELIIVDDGNRRDGVFARQAERDVRIHVIASRANEGDPAAANRAIAVSRGDIIARLDADDVALPGLVAAQVAALDADPALGIVGAGFAVIDEQDRLKQSHRRPESDFEIRWTCLFANPFVHSTVAFRRSCFDAAGGYDRAWRVSSDYEFWFRLLEHSRGANIQQELLYYRENSRGLTATHLDGWHERNDPLRQRAWERLGVPYDSGVADQLARVALGEPISDDALRAPVYRTGLALLRQLATARAEDLTDIVRVVRIILQRMGGDKLVDRAAIDGADLAWADSIAR
jgi:glycosyltransferase involved in cell wall biosynthesis